MRCSNATVGQIYSLSACLLTGVNTLAIISSAQNNLNTFVNSPLVNTTALDSSIDPRFGLKAEYGETNLPLTPCLMNIVELLAEYAELDWLSKVKGRHGVVLPEYPQVEIAILPATPATSVEVRFIIWGLWVGIRDIVGRNSFHEVEFEIFWEHQLVALIYFTLPMDHQGTSNGILDADEPLTLVPSPNQTIGGNPDISNITEHSPYALDNGIFGWNPYFAPTAKTLTVVEVFLTVMAGLKNAAPHPASQKVSGPYASAAVDVYANVQFFLHKRRSPRTKPPYFEYIHVIKSLRLIPGYMLQKGRFAELIFVIEVSGMPVGEGFLEKGHYRPHGFILGDLPVPGDNVSLS